MARASGVHVLPSQGFEHVAEVCSEASRLTSTVFSLCQYDYRNNSHNNYHRYNTIYLMGLW